MPPFLRYIFSISFCFVYWSFLQAGSLPYVQLTFPDGQERVKLNAIAEIKPEPLNEISGMSFSGIQEGMLWGHNDSGDLPRLVLFPNPINNPKALGYSNLFLFCSANLDWEDLCLAKNGKLYIGDFGDNLKRRDRYSIFHLDEPSIDHFMQFAQPHEIRFNYEYGHSIEEDQKWIHKDCEAFFEYGNSLVLLTKRLTANLSDVFILKDALTVDGNAQMTAMFAMRLKGMRGVTSAASWNGGERVAILTYRSLWVFDQKDDQDLFSLFKNPRCLKISAKQCESVCFEDAETLVVTNEQRDVYRIQLKRLNKGICRIKGGEVFVDRH